MPKANKNIVGVVITEGGRQIVLPNYDIPHVDMQLLANLTRTG